MPRSKFFPENPQCWGSARANGASILPRRQRFWRRKIRRTDACCRGSRFFMATRVESVGRSSGKTALPGHTGLAGAELAAPAASKGSASESGCGIPKRRERSRFKRPCSVGASTTSASPNPETARFVPLSWRRQQSGPALRQRQAQRERCLVSKKGESPLLPTSRRLRASS